MKILNTSDWYLGRFVHGRKYYEDFSVFLD